MRFMCIFKCLTPFSEFFRQSKQVNGKPKHGLARTVYMHPKKTLEVPLDVCRNM